MYIKKKERNKHKENHGNINVKVLSTGLTTTGLIETGVGISVLTLCLMLYVYMDTLYTLLSQSPVAPVPGAGNIITTILGDIQPL